MLHVLPASNKKSFGEKANNALGAFFNQYNEMQQQKQQALAGEKLSQLTGMDLSGLSPDMQKIALAEALRSQGKDRRQEQTQNLLGQIFGQGNKNSQMGDELMRGERQPTPNQDGFDASSLSDAQIAQATSLDPNLGRVLQHQKDLTLREKREQEKLEFEKGKISRKEDFEIIKPLIQELSNVRKNIPLQEQSIEDIKNAAPDIGWRDYAADVLGFEPGRTAEGAKLKTALKDFFLSDLTRAGSRPNMWIEQQLSDALPKIGRSPEANLIVAEGMSFKVDLAKKRMEILDDLMERDKQKYGYVKADVDSRAYKLLKPYVEQRKKEMIDKVHSIKKENKSSKKTSLASKGYTRMMNPQTGEVFDILDGHVSDAQEAGWLPQ